MWPAARPKGDPGLAGLLPGLQAEAAALRRWGSSGNEFRAKNSSDLELGTAKLDLKVTGAGEEAQELEACSRRLAAVREELHGLEESARAKEKAHAQELEDLASCLLEMDTALHLHTCNREEAAVGARWKLEEAHDELAELHTEVLLAQAEGEALGAEASAVPADDSGPWAPGWEDRVIADLDKLRSEAAALALAQKDCRLELLGLEAKQRSAEDSLRHAEKQVEGYKDWSSSLREELQQIGSELSEDRQVAARERLRLRARAAELSRSCGTGSTDKAAAANASLRLGLTRQSSLGSVGSSEAPAAPRFQHSGSRQHCERQQQETQQPLWCRKAPPKQGLSSSASAPSLH